jgi:hypothetical protein
MTERQKYFYAEGKDRGYATATWMDIPRKGEKLSAEYDPDGIGVVETADEALDAMACAAAFGEEADRDFSPFEFLAKELNDYARWCEAHGRDPQAGWNAFEEGVSDGIAAALSLRAPLVREIFTAEAEGES